MPGRLPPKLWDKSLSPTSSSDSLRPDGVYLTISLFTHHLAGLHLHADDFPLLNFFEGSRRQFSANEDAWKYMHSMILLRIVPPQSNGAL